MKPSKTAEPGERESQFELIRLVAQFFIVLYHLFLFFVYPYTNNPFHKAIWIPLHIGVPLFVLISGYFGIKSSIRGVVNLLGKMAVLYIPLSLASFYLNKIGYAHTSGFIDGGGKPLITTALFVSATPFWFMRTYLFLYLIAPVINKYFEYASFKQLIAMIGALAFFTVYVGSVGFDTSLGGGNNVTHFILLYFIGHALHRYKTRWKSISKAKLITVWIVYNTAAVGLFSVAGFSSNVFELAFQRIFFNINSIGILANAILVFMIIGSINFSSGFINKCAKASLTIYMIHCSNMALFGLIRPSVNVIIDTTCGHQLNLIALLLCLTILIIAGCIILDRLLSPIWSQINSLGIALQQRIMT